MVMILKIGWDDFEDAPEVGLKEDSKVLKIDEYVLPSNIWRKNFNQLQGLLQSEYLKYTNFY